MLDKRVYGVVGVSSVMANWNADFTGFPKTTSDGRTYGSDKALKYTMKKMWENEGEKVLYIKSMRLAENKKDVSLVPRSLSERYEQLFGAMEKEKDAGKVLKNLMQCVDVKNFGATYAEAGNNISITGAVQFGQGFNFYDETQPQEQQILSPFRNAAGESKGEEAKNSTLGTKIVSDEAHYFYPFTVNAVNYKEYMDMGVTDGYTREDYENFKRTALTSVTSYATNAKEGCENEFALFVETEADTYLPNLTSYIRFEKGEEKNTITLEAGDILKALGKSVSSVEIYYNPATTVLNTDVKGATVFNIVTGKAE